MKKTVQCCLIAGVLSVGSSSYAFQPVACPAMSQLAIANHVTTGNVVDAGPSDVPAQYPHSWYASYVMPVSGKAWGVGVGYSVKPTKAQAVAELQAAFPRLANKKPVMSDKEGLCVYKLSANGHSGAAANYVVSCQLGAPCSQTALAPLGVKSLVGGE